MPRDGLITFGDLSKLDVQRIAYGQGIDVEARTLFWNCIVRVPIHQLVVGANKTALPDPNPAYPLEALITFQWNYIGPVGP